MKKYALVYILLMFGILSVSAQNKEWLDPELNQVNRLPMHTHYFAYSLVEEAAAGIKEYSENFPTSIFG